jgi:hypothetical protein
MECVQMYVDLASHWHPPVHKVGIHLEHILEGHGPRPLGHIDGALRLGSQAAPHQWDCVLPSCGAAQGQRVTEGVTHTCGLKGNLHTHLQKREMQALTLCTCNGLNFT